jgi:hypothetical protein
VDDVRWERLWSVAAARLLLAAGRLGDARVAARCAVHVTAPANEPDLVDLAARDVLARVALATGDQGDLAEAARTVALMAASRLAEAGAAGDWLGLRLHWAWSGEVGDLGTPGRTPLTVAWPTTWFGATPEVCDDVVLARSLVRGGHRAAADALSRAAADRVTWQPHRIDVAATHHAVAGVVRRDRWASLRAAMLFERSGRPLAAAAAREDAAAAPGPGGRDRVAALLVTAIGAYDRAGAAIDGARARAELETLGGYELAHRTSRP